MFLTIWLAGIVVFTMNTETPKLCEEMKITTNEDIAKTYEKFPKFGMVDGKHYTQEDWHVTCESKPLKIGTEKWNQYTKQ